MPRKGRLEKKRTSSAEFRSHLNQLNREVENNALDLSLFPPKDAPKVAFMTGAERTYYPEDPGHSRFGIEFAMNTKPTDTPQPNYFPPSGVILSKPISKLGYGIGGLLAVRFPEPPSTSPRPEDIRKGKAEKKLSTSCEKANKEIFLDWQTIYSFGSHLSVNRFSEEPWRPVGVGYYDLQSVGLTPKIPVNDGFHGGPAFIKPSPLTYCNYEKCDECFECGVELRTQDYYRSRGVVRIPVGVLKKKLLEDRERRGDDDDGSTRLKTAPRYIALCRQCYCAALKGKYRTWGWDRAYMNWMFHKTRYCGYIHEHHQLPITLHKTTCKLVEKLNRKEAVMRKHYHDVCERTLKQKARVGKVKNY